MRSLHADGVVRALGLRTVQPANWRSGLAHARERGVFVTPALDGWVLAVGEDLRGDQQEDRLVPELLQRLSATFGKAAWFATHAQGERHGWALGERGELVRGYAFDGERGHVFWSGDVTDAERELNCFVDDPRDHSEDEVKWWPDERIVLAMAAAWSLDPRTLGERGRGVSAGWHGRL